MKLVINPAYEIVKEKPCNHRREVVKIGGTVIEFCDICNKAYVRP